MRSRPCCMVGLKNGAFALGIFELIIWAMTFAVSGYRVAEIWKFETILKSDDSVREFLDKLDPDVRKGFSIGTLTLPEASMCRTLGALYMALSIVGIFMSILLLLGIFKDNVMMIKRWIFFKIPVLVLSIILFATSINLYEGYDLFGVLFVFLNVAGGWYSLWVCHELKTEMKSCVGIISTANNKNLDDSEMKTVPA